MTGASIAGLLVAQAVADPGMTGAEIGTLVVQILVGLGGLAGISSLFLVRAQKRKLVADSGKTDAEADTAFSEAYNRRAATQVSLIDPYERVMGRMQEELDEANDRVDYLEAYITLLVDAMREAGITIPPRPPKPGADRPTPINSRRRRRN